MAAFVTRNIPGVIGFLLSMVGGFYMHVRAQDSRAIYPPVSNLFIVNQTICLPPQVVEGSTCKPVTVAAGAVVMLQLPANPASWTIVSASPNLVPQGVVERLPNPGRYDGTSELLQWHFSATRAGDATLVMREFPPTISGSPAGTFTYTFQIR